jgi:EAL domain-containing protein (putative c-di-GMP-specific phosphodiesterase class I)
MAYAAEERVRAGGGSSVSWEGARLTTHFQPIYNVRRGTCLGYEALARAASSSGGDLDVEDFFANVDEESRSLLDWTCRALHLRNFATVDPGDRTLFINVHPEAAVRDARNGHDLGEIIGYYGLVPERVCIEILEAPCSDESMLREAVDAYRDLGASVAMGDFGLARSDFDRLARLRPNIVKIDLAAHSRKSGSAQALGMLPGMIDLVHEAGAKVAVEGIESRTEALLAVGARADFLQGYFLAQPHAKLAPEIQGTTILNALLSPAARPHLALI